jgi:hypothetical protein
MIHKITLQRTEKFRGGYWLLFYVGCKKKEKTFNFFLQIAKRLIIPISMIGSHGDTGVYVVFVKDRDSVGTSIVGI